MTLLLLPQCHAAFSTIPSTLPWVARAPLASVCHSNPLQSIPSTPVTASHVTPGMDSHNPEVRTRGWIYGRLLPLTEPNPTDNLVHVMVSQQTGAQNCN